MKRVYLPAAVPAIAVMAMAGALPASADVTLGRDARTFAMGGAGLALVEAGDWGAARLNPAALALQKRGFATYFPSLSLRAHGIRLGETVGRLFEGSLDPDDATDLARAFGKRDSELGLGADWGLRFGSFELLAEGSAQARLLPNEALRAWARAGGDESAVPPDAGADVLGIAVYAPAVSYAHTISRIGAAKTPLDAGLRIKYLRAVYSHYLVSAANVAGDERNAPHAPEMNGKNTLSRSGVGVDLGLLLHPRTRRGFSAALIVTDLINPALHFDGTDRNGAPKRYDLRPTAVSAGTALRRGDFLFAADAVDITGAYGDASLRLGAEARRGRWAYRAGYASAQGLTFGLGVGGFDIAFSANSPLRVSQVVRF